MNKEEQIFSFPKIERLKSFKRIDQLFIDGQSIHEFPVKLVYLQQTIVDDENRPAIQAAFSVPKRNHRKAVKRNRYKRQMREAYRLCRSSYVEELMQQQIYLDLMFIYASKKKESYQDIAEAIEKSLGRMLDKIKNHG